MIGSGIRTLSLLFALAAMLPYSAAAQNAVPALRANVTVTSGVVRIGDVVENAGAAADIPIFRSPDLGTRGTVPTQSILDAIRPHQLVDIDTRGLADDLSTEIAEDSDVVFLPTGVSDDDLGPTLSLARKLARRGAEGRLVIVLSKVGRSETQFSKAVEAIEDAGFELLGEHWPQRDGFQGDLDSGRAGREARNPYLREIAERMEDALYARAMKAKPRG